MMSAEDYKYLLIGLFAIVIIGSFYLVFKSGFKLEKRKKDTPLIMSKKELDKDFKLDLKLDVIFFIALLLLILYTEKCSS